MNALRANALTSYEASLEHFNIASESFVCEAYFIEIGYYRIIIPKYSSIRTRT